MRLATATAAAMLAVSLSACAHTQNAALRMPRPDDGARDLAAFAPPDPDYPSVGGDILKGTSPSATAAYQATTGAAATAPPAKAP